MFVIYTTTVFLRGPVHLVHGEFEPEQDLQFKSPSCQPENKADDGEKEVKEDHIEIEGKKQKMSSLNSTPLSKASTRSTVT